MSQYQLRPMTLDDRSEVADLICVSTNYWYRTRGGSDIFPPAPPPRKFSSTSIRRWTPAAAWWPSIGKRAG